MQKTFMVMSPYYPQAQSVEDTHVCERRVWWTVHRRRRRWPRRWRGTQCPTEEAAAAPRSDPQEPSTTAEKTPEPSADHHSTTTTRPEPQAAQSVTVFEEKPEWLKLFWQRMFPQWSQTHFRTRAGLSDRRQRVVWGEMEIEFNVQML